MAVGPTPILHILNHYHTTVVLTKFDILTRPAELHHVTEVSNHMHTIQKFSAPTNKTELASKTESAVHKISW